MSMKPSRRPEHTRQRLHRAGVAFVEHELLSRGCDVNTLHGTDGLTFHAWSRIGHPRTKPITVAVRAARVRAVQHAVTVGGKRYVYRYDHLHWNLHSHAERRCHPDVWVLVAIGRPSTAFVVPGAVLPTTQTVQLQADPKPGRAGALVRAYEGRWDLITGEKRRRGGVERAA